MISTSIPFRSALLTLTLVALPMYSVHAVEAARIVFQNGRSVPVSAVVVKGDQIVLKSAVEGYNEGQTFPMASADHIYGEKPVEVNRGIAMLLMGKPADGLALLEPVVEQQKMSAKIPGNFWLEAAQATLVGYALTGDSGKVTAIGKEISDASAGPGSDPFVSLGKALLLPKSNRQEVVETAFRDLTTDNLPASVCAYASFFLGNALKSANKDQEALEAYLSVPCLFPSGGMILNAVAELNAAEYLSAQGRRDEALVLLNSCVRQSSDTIVVVEANNGLESLK
jgi:tetratricopeptide (TPR) repeat protein